MNKKETEEMEKTQQRLKEAEALILQISQTYEQNNDIKEDQPETREGNILLHIVTQSRKYILTHTDTKETNGI